MVFAIFANTIVSTVHRCSETITVAFFAPALDAATSRDLHLLAITCLAYLCMQLIMCSFECIGVL
jgi:hypothetical protein